MAKKTMSQAEYARHRGISPARISTLIKTGKIPPSCYSIVSGKRQIAPYKADKALSENLDQVHNPKRNQPPDPAILQAQEAASDFASGPGDEEEKKVFPSWPLWALRYIVHLQDISPKQVEIFKHDKTNFSINVNDWNNDDNNFAPWTLRLNFVFGESE